MAGLEVKLVWNGDKEKAQMSDAIYKALIRASNKVQADAQLIVAKDTTNLETSIDKVVDKNKQIGTVLTNSKYAFAQEFGRPDLENYTFTPYMRPALKNNKANIKKMFIEEGKKAIDK